jgi:four helix bundle protein
MAYQDIEESRLYQRVEELADKIWDIVISWDSFAKDTVGKQLTRAADSIGANLAESNGRYHPNDVIRFLYYSRGSMKETRYWLRRAKKRRLINESEVVSFFRDLDQIGRELNGYINFQRKRIVKEEGIEYRIDE